MRIRKLTTIAATAAVAIAGVAATAPSALADGPPDYHGAVLQITTQDGLALDVSGASKGDGAPVIQWTPHSGANQRWRFVRVGAHYEIRSVNSNKCLTASDPAGPSPVVQWVCHRDRLNQQWDVEPGGFFSDPQNHVTIRSASSGLPLTVSGLPPVPGRQLTVHASQLGDDPGELFDLAGPVR